LAAALWAGGVAALCVAMYVLLRAGRRASARALARAFGGFAAVIVGLLTLSGIAIMGAHVHSLDSLVSTAYGQTLMVKLGLFVMAGSIGLVTTLAVRSSWAPRPLRASWIRAPRLELAVLAATLVPAALLTASAPARESSGPRLQPAATAPAAAKTFATVGDVIMSVVVEPDRPGKNFVTVSAVSTRRPAPGPIMAVALSIGRAGGRPETVPLSPLGSDQWQGVTTLPAGTVTIGTVVRRSGLPAVRATTVRDVAAAGAPAVSRPVQIEGGGVMRRPLEPVLTRIAIVGAVLMMAVLAFVALRARGRIPPLRTRATPRAPGELRPRRVER
ncbi:MAG: copper transport protein, partial [Gaiellales bacterium]|nr:copper transport protein [Gaiellales bacterium]